ncbi:MAG: MarR family transcriptional regulator, partial [Lachnospiraceae bacterium]|nr:MarR family transcriptional regulator [Lachnospiraceae bacterium]
MTENTICPGCGRHCNLSEPHCKRGEEYCRTGKMPEQRQGEKQYHEMRRAHYQIADMNDKLMINLRDLGHMMHLLYDGKASQKRILIILNELDTITQKDLTERLGIQPGSASEILSKMESAGWICRTQNETDRRTTDVCLTESGREQATEALAQRRKRHEDMFSCLSEAEKQELLTLLETVCADWRTRYGEHGHHHGHHGGEDHHGGHGHHGGESDANRHLHDAGPP